MDQAFSNDKYLRSVVIPSGVTSLSSTFNNCTRFKSVTLPSTITNIASSAFSYSDDDTVYYLEATTPPTLSGYLNGKWYVPRAALADYAEAVNWWGMYEDGQVLAYDY